MNAQAKAGLAGILLGLGLAACSVKLDNDLKYTCTDDKDCGGDNYKCTTGTGKGWCCQVTNNGEEICDGKDNDCDGKIDNTGKAEVCNGVDDNCNGKIDENFDLQTQNANCGSCTTQCTGTESCTQGKCVKPTEVDCADGKDNDGNGKTDCQDPSCDTRSCGTGCVCASLAKKENACADGADNDGDTLVDCADPDCAGQFCGAGCQCGVDGGVKTEDNCYDALDNDGDGNTDCADSDCLANFCTDTTSGLYWTCAPGGVCNCHGTQGFQESTKVYCSDGIDNDCDGQKDCADPFCDMKGCTPLSDTDCVCKSGKKTEGNCQNGVDDDGDTTTDCADSDCDGKTCNKTGGGTGVCTAGTCQ